MALAVAEAWRVLRPGGLLFDIHPNEQPLRLEAWRGIGSLTAGSTDPRDFQRQALGSVDDAFLEEFTASNRTLAAAAGNGFQLQHQQAFDYRYFFDSLDELTTYLEDNEELDLADDAVLERALAALQTAAGPTRLVLVQPVIATRLQKVS